MNKNKKSDLQHRLFDFEDDVMEIRDCITNAAWDLTDYTLIKGNFQSAAQRLHEALKKTRKLQSNLSHEIRQLNAMQNKEK